jgi:VWFA-related protein
MKNFILKVAALMLVAIPTFAQDIKPRPTPPDTDVVKISTNLIQVDVTVTDSKGKAIADLRPDEIEIFENGEKQKITAFTFVSGGRAVEGKPAAVDRNAIPVPPTTLRPDQIRRTFAVVVDDLSLSFESAYHTRRALKKFVDEQMQDGDLVAIIRTGAGIGALQQFTADKRILYAAIEKVKWNPQGNGGISAFAPIEPPLPGEPTESEDPAGEDGPAESDLAKGLDDFRSSVFATGTLGALRYIVRGMSELPGRKSVILFSDGFKMFDEDENGFRESGQVMGFLQQLVDTANRSSVTFYTVDPRGLVFTGFTAADSPSNISGQALSALISSRNTQLRDTQDGLSYLASETGGFDIKNNNDLSGGVRKVLEDQSYYLVAYEPDTDTFDPAKRKYNELTVKVTRKDAKVRYRSGFFNVADNVTPNGPAAATAVGQLELALVSPFAVSGINLRLNALFGNDLKNGSFVRSLLHIDGADLKFVDDKDGVKKAVFEVVAMSFGDNGQPVDRLGKSYTLTAKGETLKKISTEGFVYHFTFPVKKPGAYQYRVAIRDTQSGKVGSASQFIEVPDLKKDRLSTSSIVLESVTAAEWQKQADPTAIRAPSNPMGDTALRRIKAGTVLRYGYEIYNAKLDTTKRPALEARIRVFRDGKVILDGKQSPIVLLGQTDMGE